MLLLVFACAQIKYDTCLKFQGAHIHVAEVSWASIFCRKSSHLAFFNTTHFICFATSIQPWNHSIHYHLLTISPTIIMSKSSIISFLLFFIASSSMMATATVTTAPTHNRVAAVDELWYPDYASSSGYDTGRCTNTPSSSLLKLTNYVSSGYTDRASCCRASFPGQMNNSYCSCMGGCSSSTSEDDDNILLANDDIEFDMEIVYKKLVNNTQEFESFQEQETMYWEQLSSLLRPTSW